MPTKLMPIQRYISVLVTRSDLDAEVAWEAYRTMYPDAEQFKEFFMKQWHDCLNHRGAYAAS